jgi:hypothetical protein
MTDPNAMDTTPDRIRGRVAQDKDFLPGGNRYQQRAAGVKKEESLEDWCNRMGQGKCSPVSIAANQVTLKETVDSR